MPYTLAPVDLRVGLDSVTAKNTQVVVLLLVITSDFIGEHDSHRAGAIPKSRLLAIRGRYLYLSGV